MRRPPLLAWALFALASCASTRWDGTVARTGTLREVLVEGRTEGRIGLWRAERPDRWGIGVLEGLAGEIVVADGFVWTATGLSPTQARTEGGVPHGAKAAFLALARVPRWREVVIERPLDLEGLLERARALAREEGWDPKRPLPLRVRGPLEAIELHVLRGACPRVDPKAHPFRADLAPARGTLVGFLAEGAVGELVHHGEAAHLHALLREPATLVGHVDRVRTAAGARLAVPLGSPDS